MPLPISYAEQLLHKTSTLLLQSARVLCNPSSWCSWYSLRWNMGERQGIIPFGTMDVGSWDKAGYISTSCGLAASKIQPWQDFGALQAQPVSMTPAAAPQQYMPAACCRAVGCVETLKPLCSSTTACTLLTIRHIVQAGLGASGRSTAMHPQQRAHMASHPQLLGSFRGAGQQEGQGVVGRHLCRLLHRLQALHDSKWAHERTREGACMRGCVAQPVSVTA